MTKKKHSKFKAFVKKADSYYNATKRGLVEAGQGLKEGYNSFTGAVDENLQTLNNTGFVQDFRRGLNNAVPYMKSKKRYIVIWNGNRQKVATCLANNLQEAKYKMSRVFNMPLKMLEENYTIFPEGGF